MNKEQIYKEITKMKNGSAAVYCYAWQNAEKIMTSDGADMEVLNKTIKNALWANMTFKIDEDMKVLETICNWFYVDPQLFLLYLH